MLSHKVLSRESIDDCASYYNDGADDYYANEGNSKEWGGKGAAILGLVGDVDAEKFQELLAGIVDKKEHHKSTRNDSRKRLGIDLTFSAPKSVSIQALVGKDNNVILAHDIAVQKAIDETEKYAQTRKKINKKSFVENTKNLIVAKFRHETNREADPQLHTHAVVLNLTQREDGEWRALKNDQIIKSTKFLGAVYRAELAKQLQKLGYELRHERDGMFELAHISREQIKEFSKRSTQIENILVEKGLSRANATTGDKQLATLQSRKRKTKIDREKLHNEWAKKALDVNLSLDQRELYINKENKHEVSNIIDTIVVDKAAKRSVKYAVNHLTERQSVIKQTELIDVALKHGMGSITIVDVINEINNQTSSGFLIKNDQRFSIVDTTKRTYKTKQQWIDYFVSQDRLSKVVAKSYVSRMIKNNELEKEEVKFTTQTALTREQTILKIEKEARNKLDSLINISELDKVAKDNLSRLSGGQKKAVELIVTSNNQFNGVQGLAGTGKSHMLKTVDELLNKSGYKLRAVAPYGNQVKSLRSDGIKANTLASFLRAKENDIDNKTVLVIDEAGVVPTRLIEQTFKLAQKKGTRVVLLGDTQQTKAIEAGKPFAQLQAAGMKTAQMSDILRQKDEKLRSAVELAAVGKTKDSLSKLSSVVQIKGENRRYETIASDYVNLEEKERENTLIVAGTNDARLKINDFVREKIGVKGQGIEFNCLIRRDTTKEERLYSKNYRIGDIIQPEKNYEKLGLKRGSLYEITDTGPGNRLTVRDKSETELKQPKLIEFSPHTYRKISVYEQRKTELSVGEQVKITRNDAEKDLANGDRMKVVAISNKSLVLDDNGKRRVKLDTSTSLHLDHAYVTTIHGSQGLTSEKVLIEANTKSITTSKDVYYVAISRAKNEARIYTDSKKSLPTAISRQLDKASALDITKQHLKQKAIEVELKA